ncbi:unnamed protein product, partial [Mesorhabditis spiculigera]
MSEQPAGFNPTDALYAYPYIMAAIDPIQDPQFALIYLIRVLESFVDHENQHPAPLLLCELGKLFYQLISYRPLTYQDLRRVAGQIGEAVLRDFDKVISQVQMGDLREHITLIEELGIDIKNSIINGNSLVAVFLKKFSLATTMLTDYEVYGQFERQLKYLAGEWQYKPSLYPHVSNSYKQAEKWVLSRLHWLQRCPSRVQETDEEIMAICERTKQLYPIMAAVHLLISVVETRRLRARNAEDALADSVGTLVRSRLARHFNNFAMARTMLDETVMLSHGCKDNHTLRMAVAEKKILEYQNERTDPTAKYIPDQHDDYPSQEDIWFFQESDDVYDGSAAQCVEFIDTLLDTIRQISSGKPTYCNVTPMFSTSAWMRGNDPTGEQKAYLDVADAIKSSALLLHGHLDQTFQMAKCWNGTNNGDRYAKYHETEAHAIFNVNTMYALALDCQWGQALQLVDRAIAQFGPRASDRIKGHLKLAKALIKFDSRLFGCDLEGAAEQLPLIEPYCPFEHVIRLALHHACTGQLSEAIQLLNAYRPKIAGDVHTLERIRLLSVLGNLHTVNRNLTEAEASLVKAVRLARVSQAKPLMWLTTRHLARVMIEQNKFDEAAQLLRDDSDDLGGRRGIERALYCATVAELHLKKGDSQEALKWLGLFLEVSSKAGIFAWAKDALFHATRIFSDAGDVEARDASALAMWRAHEKHPQSLDWKLF